MSRNLDTPEEQLMLKVMASAAADPKLASMAYRLVNGTPRSYFTAEEANKMRRLIKQHVDGMRKLVGEEE